MATISEMEEALERFRAGTHTPQDIELVNAGIKQLIEAWKPVWEYLIQCFNNLSKAIGLLYQQARTVGLLDDAEEEE